MIQIDREIELAKKLMPEFPSTLHLAFEPNATQDDKIETLVNSLAFLDHSTGHVVVEEKIDASNCGLAVINDQPFVRNRNHVLRKGYSARKTPAQQQFHRIWTWLYEKSSSKCLNYQKILNVCDIVGAPVTVYGEWCYARHVIPYNALPDLFIAYDIWDQDMEKFLDPIVTRGILEKAGFAIPEKRGSTCCVPLTEGVLAHMRDQITAFSDNRTMSEGIYLKKGDGQWCTGRYKMVTPGFQTDEEWNRKTLLRNELR